MSLSIHVKKDYYAYMTTDSPKLFKLIERSFTRKVSKYNNYFKFYETLNKSFYTLVDNKSTIKVKAGLIPFLCASLDKVGIEYSLVDDRKPLKITNIVTQLNENVKLREYQIEAVTKALTVNNGFNNLQLPTSTGKTEISASIIKSFLLSYPEEAVLYIVPTCILKDEAKERFENYGIETNTTFPIKSGCVNILTHMAMIRVNKTTFNYKQRNNVGLFICDEAHHLSSDKLSKVVHDLHGLRACIGVSATISAESDLKKNRQFLKQLNANELNIYGCTGPNAYYMTIEESINNKFITPIEIKVISNKTKYNLGEDEETDWIKVKDTVIKGDTRIKLVTQKLISLIRDDNFNTVALLTPEVAISNVYMKSIADCFKNDKDILIFELHGNKKVYKYENGVSIEIKSNEEKDLVMQQIKNPNIKTIFSATSFFFEGANITNLQAIINCYGGRSEKRIKQQCGRVVRLFKDKDVAYIYEILDVFNIALSSQFEKRINIYKSEYKARISYEK